MTWWGLGEPSQHKINYQIWLIEDTCSARLTMTFWGRGLAFDDDCCMSCIHCVSSLVIYKVWQYDSVTAVCVIMGKCLFPFDIEMFAHLRYFNNEISTTLLCATGTRGRWEAKKSNREKRDLKTISHILKGEREIWIKFSQFQDEK